MKENTTTELLSILNSCNSESSLIRHLNSNLNPSSFFEYYMDIINNRGFKKSDLLISCGLSKAALYHILDGTRTPSRNSIIKLCIAAKLNLVETNRCLFLGKCSELYPRDPRDSIIIFCINNGNDLINTELLLDSRNLQILS